MPSYNRITGRQSRNVAGIVGVELNTEAATQKLDRLIVANLGLMANQLALAAAHQFIAVAQAHAPHQQPNTDPKGSGLQNEHLNENEGHFLSDSQSFRIVPIGPANFRIENVAPWAASVEFGAREHMIYPREASHLTFWWENEGRVFKKGAQVDHPGQAPQPFMGPAAAAFAPTYNAMIRRAFKEVGF